MYAVERRSQSQERPFRTSQAQQDSRVEYAQNPRVDYAPAPAPPAGNNIMVAAAMMPAHAHESAPMQEEAHEQEAPEDQRAQEPIIQEEAAEPVQEKRKKM